MKTRYMLSVTVAALLTAFSARSASAQSAGDLCDRASEGKTTSVTYGKFEVQTVTYRDSGAGLCRFRVVSASGEVLAKDEGFAGVTARYVDLDEDNVAELIVVAVPYGSAGQSDSYIFTQTPQVRLLKTIRSCGMGVARHPDSTYPVLVFCESAFGSFDGLCNACSPRPPVFLTLEQGQLRDRSSLFAPIYDERIAASRKQISDQDAQAFVKSQNADDAAYGLDTRQVVLSLVIDYLYSGREGQARQTLETMWPSWDRERIWNDIVRTRTAGVLKPLQ